MWVDDTFLDVLEVHVAPLIQSSDPYGAAAARQTCSSWSAAFRGANHACIKVNFWTHGDVLSFSQWLVRSNLGGVKSLQLSTEDQEFTTGEDAAISLRALADSLPLRYLTIVAGIIH